MTEQEQAFWMKVFLAKVVDNGSTVAASYATEAVKIMRETEAYFRCS